MVGVVTCCIHTLLELVCNEPVLVFFYSRTIPGQTLRYVFSSSQSHAGLFNLCIVVLIAVNSRLIIENLMKVIDVSQLRALFKIYFVGECLCSPY